MKLEQVSDEKLNEQGIRHDSKLKVHIVDAVNLPDNKNYQVKVYQGESFSETNIREGSGPIWNEAILFDIKDTKAPIIVEIVPIGALGAGDSVLKNLISL